MRAIAPIVGVTQQRVSQISRQVTNDLSPEPNPAPPNAATATGETQVMQMHHLRRIPQVRNIAHLDGRQVSYLRHLTPPRPPWTPRQV